MDPARRVRFISRGGELIDTLDAVLRYDFATRELPNHTLKAVARHLGIAGPDREYICGGEIYTVYRRDPDRVRRYATADVEEVARLAHVLGGAAFALAQIAPRRYERLADAGVATGVIDPLLVRAYLRSGKALPAYRSGDGTPHSGAALHLFATGVAHRVVKTDVASLYPSLMRAYRIGPSRDHLGAMLALVDRVVEVRLAAKANARKAPPGSAERYGYEGTSAAMKLVVNSAYGYLASRGTYTISAVRDRPVTQRGCYGRTRGFSRNLGCVTPARVADARRLLLHKLTKTPQRYFEARESRRELLYEAMLAAGRNSWSVGDRIRVYRRKTGTGGLIDESEDEAARIGSADNRDYDIEHYVRVLHQTFVSRLACAFTAEDYETVFADPNQMSLFAPPVGGIRTVLTSNRG